MQYVGRAIGSVSKTWNSLNPSTLSGAIDVVVIERETGDLHCSAFHIRFGKFALLQPTHRGVDFWVNDRKIGAQMKLGEGGEAFFVFATEADVPESMLTSPVISPATSPRTEYASDDEPEFLNLADSNGASNGTDTQQQLNTDSQNPLDIKAHQAAEQLLGPDLIEDDDKAPREWMRTHNPDEIDALARQLSEVNIPSTTNDAGEVLIDMTGYKPGGENTQALENVVQQIMRYDLRFSHEADPMINTDGVPMGDSRFSGKPEPEEVAPDHVATPEPTSPSEPGSPRSVRSVSSSRRKLHYVKTLRLTSDMLKSLDLKPGKNTMKFQVRNSKAIVTASIFLWDQSTPVVISDIDGTITRSDAMGHVMTMIGRDWTHAGIAKLYADIARNGYNIIYLTARAVGQADATRSYLGSIDQGGYTLPPGPVILSPDRTIAALHREVIMRKPEIFKMACLRDIWQLYSLQQSPFYAGFGNKITDALSYRSVGVPSTKIFTINSNSEVKMELLELTGYKSNYMLISDMVDHFFPPFGTGAIGTRSDTSEFTDVNFWRPALPSLSDDTDESYSSSDDDSVVYTAKLTATFGGGLRSPNSPRSSGSSTVPDISSRDGPREASKLKASHSDSDLGHFSDSESSVAAVPTIHAIFEATDDEATDDEATDDEDDDDDDDDDDEDEDDPNGRWNAT